MYQKEGPYEFNIESPIESTPPQHFRECLLAVPRVVNAWLTNAAGARTHSGQGFLLLCATKNRAPDSHAFERYWPFGMLATTYNHCTILVSYLVFAFWCPFVFEKLSEIVCICIHTWLFMK